MSITFSKVPTGTLNRDGSISGVQAKQAAPNIGMDTKEFHNQVIQLAQNKVPLEKAIKAIDQHPEIQDKEKAKSMAQSVYDIIKDK